MPGRGHGRLLGTSPGENSWSSGRGRGRVMPIRPIESRPVRTRSPVSREQYNKNKLNSALHPDDAGLGDEYVGSLPWHIRNHGLTWVPKEQRRISTSNPSPSGHDDGLKPVSTLVLPSNDDTIARDYDELSDELDYCQINRLEFLWTILGQDKEEQAARSTGVRGRLRMRVARKYPVKNGMYARVNYFRPGIFPNFPKFPSGGNPFSILPSTSDGIYPFDQYGRMLFSSNLLQKWKNDPKARAELLEVQIRKLIQMNELDGRLDDCFVSSEFASYGSLTLWAENRERGDRIRDTPPKAEPNSIEPDSGFVTFDGPSDPWAGKVDRLSFNEYSWEANEGTGFVRVNEPFSNSERASIILTQVIFYWAIFLG